MKTILTPEQVQRLLDICDGVDTSNKTYPPAAPWQKVDNPLFNIGGILELLPKEIYDIEGLVTLYLVMEYNGNNTWLASYREYCCCEIETETGPKVASELIDALYELLVWVLENHPKSIKRLK